MAECEKEVKDDDETKDEKLVGCDRIKMSFVTINCVQKQAR